MTARQMPPSGLTSVTVVVANRRIDVTVPDLASVGELMPYLLAGVDDEAVDAADRGWILHGADGSPLAPTLGLAAQGIRPGDVLELVARPVRQPDVPYDDVVEVIATGARLAGPAWTGMATRRAGLAATASIALLALAELVGTGPPWPAPAAAASVVAAVLVVTGLVLSRALADATAGGVVAAASLPFAFTAGALLAAPAMMPLAQFGARQLLVASVLLLTVSLWAGTAVAALPRLFTAGQVAGAAGVLAAALCSFAIPPAGAAAITLAATVGLQPVGPPVARWLGDALTRRSRGPAGAFAAVARAEGLAGGMALGAAAVVIACVAVLLRAPSIATVALAGAASAALVLRSLLIAKRHQALPLVAGGIVGMVIIVVGLGARMGAVEARLLLAAVLLVVGLVVLSAPRGDRRPARPARVRVLSVLEIVLVTGLFPLTFMVIQA